MDKSVLLVLLALQAFLIITAFTSTDAAAQRRDVQVPPHLRQPPRNAARFGWIDCRYRPSVCGYLERQPVGRRWGYWDGCRDTPGACSLFGEKKDLKLATIFRT